MSNFCLALCRFCLSAWLGAAALFVTAGVAEIQSNKFDSATVNDLVAARFPHYYNFGFSLVILALVGSVLARKNPAWSEKRSSGVACIMLFVFMLMLVDYMTVFLPLLKMMSKPTLSGDFYESHQASKYLNLVELNFVFIAAWVACWPGPKNRSVDPFES
ncbi:MAG: hypothetical protein P8M30_20855 [Planctomycetaceae bacterium]|jgi:hypothetical protein|nr:hypothetical protein [bacterium]MDB4680061.1 hypothetical protein [Planctomycetaceae bacterium]MDB4786985.1 hypothetical protein [Planctomycetaceae bacterium]MDC0273130.1 hypothetical protein [Planctomycetaceae bacterium]MDG2391763.1 hypothetical protein [Planctomycetaceae bacterium]